MPPGKSETWAEQLVEFYEGVLRSGLVLPSSGGLAEGMRQPSVSTEVYANILTGAGLQSPLRNVQKLTHLSQRPCRIWLCLSLLACARVANVVSLGQQQ